MMISVNFCRSAKSISALSRRISEKAGVIMDYDQAGNLVGMEILNASQCMENPRSVEYAVAV
ncbi:MAG: DUF2283 domain-containing protein [Magnetococcales bacterium]|nr:DUF2283 domain-containing protein [Magnetococcales bacterium]